METHEDVKGWITITLQDGEDRVIGISGHIREWGVDIHNSSEGELLVKGVDNDYSYVEEQPVRPGERLRVYVRGNDLVLRNQSGAPIQLRYGAIR